jgi:hypothetical protein
MPEIVADPPSRSRITCFFPVITCFPGLQSKNFNDLLPDPFLPRGRDAREPMGHG